MQLFNLLLSSFQTFKDLCYREPDKQYISWLFNLFCVVFYAVFEKKICYTCTNECFLGKRPELPTGPFILTPASQSQP